ncbi:MAG: NUDIX hydrolase [Oscillospiraceae bacterium]|nr:NUDIX hydrolase [Oscillospiraceae bacterium]
MDMTESRVSGETIFNGKIFSVKKDKVLIPDGTAAIREVICHPGGVGVLAIDGEDAILVRQYRYAVGKELLEIPAGRLEPGENPQEAGQRELSEETGYTAQSMQYLGDMVPTGGYNSEIIHLFLATGLTKGEPNPDPGEFTVPERVNFKKLVEMIMSNEISDGKTMFAVLKYYIMSTRKL